MDKADIFCQLLQIIGNYRRSAELFALGHASKSGKAFTASSVRKMLV